MPESFFFRWITVGWFYVVDMMDYNVYEETGSYEKKVLLMHDSTDSIVSISYSGRADYYVMDGMDHGFGGTTFLHKFYLLIG